MKCGCGSRKYQRLLYVLEYEKHTLICESIKHPPPSEQFIIILNKKKKLAAMFLIMHNVWFHSIFSRILQMILKLNGF